MERISQREYVLLGYSPRRSFENSMKTSVAIDFSDVFGGPPRRYSIQETRTRYSFGEKRVESEKGTVFPLSGLDEKPVFGEESANRKSYSNDDFFDDIFKGDEAKSRRTSRDFFAASPGSRVLSPSRPLPPKAEPFSPSFPAQFSLPAKLTKAMDFSLLGSTNRSPYKNRDGNSNGTSHEHTSNLSRCASQATDIKDETRSNRPLHRPSPLPHEVSHNSQEASFETESDGKEMGDKMKNYSESKEVPLNNDQFHFSIYKWAGSGVPFFMPFGRRSKSRCKERFKTERCSSSNRRIQSESSDEKKMEPCNDVEEGQIKIPESNFFQSEGYSIPQGEAFSRKKTEEESRSKDETNVCSKNEKDTNLNKGQDFKIEPKPLHGLLDENQGQGNTVRGNEKMDRVTNKVNLSTSAKKHDAKRININRLEATKTSLQSSATYTQDAFDRNTVKGKVRDFVKIFNQQTSAKPKTDTASQSSRWKRMDLNGTENGANNAVRTDEEVHKLDKNKLSESFSREDDGFNKIKVKQESHFKSSAHKTSSQSDNKKNASVFSDSFPSNYDNKGKIREDSFRAYFLVEELTQVEDKSSQTNGDSEDIKAWNAKIQQWSNRRKRNIRSLLSTLQFVLWAESGWKPVALIDLIEGNAVKKAYQKALLCLHPDKLQQKGAAAHQKYIAEQVFDILQEAWDHFNLLGAI